MEENKKIKVLSITPNKSGVGFFRSIRPHTYLDEFYKDRFDITIIEPHQFDFSNPEFGCDFDIVHFHTTVGEFNNWQNKINQLKKHNVTVVMDLDDFYRVPANSHLYQHYKNGVSKGITDTIKMCDHITTTTEIFAKEIKKLNPNVTVIPNAIDQREKQFEPSNGSSKRLRVGLIMGSSHEKDVELLKGVVSMLPLDKIQIVLCGYDLRGETTYFDKQTGTYKQRPLEPMESVWYRYEKILTDNYSIVSNDYKNYLLQFNPMSQYPNEDNEPYIRRWTKPVTSYGTHYKDIDVLLVPLVNDEFNTKKSQLKVVEAAFTNKAIIASNVGPYTIDLKSVYLKNGVIDENGNSILLDQYARAKHWVKAINLFVKNRDLMNKSKENLRSEITAKYNLGEVSKIRAELYQKIVKK